MGDRMQLAVGLMGDAASLLLFTSPVMTFSRVIRKKNTENVSCIPYIFRLLTCLIKTWYGLPIASSRWENFPLASINGLGILLDNSFIAIYIWLATTKGKMKVAAVMIPVLLLFCVTAIVSALLFHDHHHHEVFVGCVGVLAAVVMHGSSLVAVTQVIPTKRVQYMSFYLSFLSFTASTLRMTYGLLGHNMLIAGPNMAGAALSVLQLVLYFRYRKSSGIIEEPNKWDIEENVEKSNQLQLERSNNNSNCKSGESKVLEV